MPEFVANIESLSTGISLCSVPHNQRPFDSDGKGVNLLGYTCKGYYGSAEVFGQSGHIVDRPQAQAPISSTRFRDVLDIAHTRHLVVAWYTYFRQFQVFLKCPNQPVDHFASRNCHLFDAAFGGHQATKMKLVLIQLQFPVEEEVALDLQGVCELGQQLHRWFALPRLQFV